MPTAPRKKTAAPKAPAPVPTDLAEKLAIKSAAAWRPEQGDMISGKVAAILRRDGEYGPYPMLVLNTADGYTAIHAFHGVLYNQLRELRPAKDTELTVVYLGRADSHKRKDGKGKAVSYHNYAVVTDGVDSTEEFDFGEADESAEDDEPGF